MGYVFMFVFNNLSWYFILIMIGIMIVFVIYNLIKRVKEEMLKEFKRIIVYFMMFGVFVIVIFFIIVVFKVCLWFNL